MSNLYSQLGYSREEFRALQQIVVVVFETVEKYFSWHLILVLHMYLHIPLYLMIQQQACFFYSLIFMSQIMFFAKYPCTRIIHRCSLSNLSTC